MSAPEYPIESLLVEAERLPRIQEWLTNQVFSPERYAAMAPADFLREGEAAVCRLEEIISTGAVRSAGCTTAKLLSISTAAVGGVSEFQH